MRTFRFLFPVLVPAQLALPLQQLRINDSVKDSSGIVAPSGGQIDDNYQNTFRPSIAVIIAVLVTMFSLTFLLLLYAKHCKRNAMGVVGGEETISNIPAARPRVSGVDRSVVESLPIFSFSALKGMKEGLECAVCLSAFEESEVLRLLPKCKHAFHIECVDTWLDAHSSCPLCRHKVEPDDVLLAEDITSTKNAASSANFAEIQLPEDGPVEFFVQRETETERSFRSARFSIDRIGSLRRDSSRRETIGLRGLDRDSSRRETIGLRCLDKLTGSGRKDELLLAESERDDDERFANRFAHRIIVSDVFFQRRWSDFKPSDLQFLDSQMLGTGSSRRFSTSQLQESKSYSSHSGRGLESTPRQSGRKTAGASEKISKIKDEMEKKRKLDKQASRMKNSSSASSGKLEVSKEKQPESRKDDSRGRLLDMTSPRRSVSEITSFDRYGQTRTMNMLPLVFKGTSFPNKDEEKLKRWLSIARRTLQWFAGREKRHTVSGYHYKDSISTT